MKLFFFLSLSATMSLALPTKDYLASLSCLKSLNLAGIKLDSITPDSSFLIEGSAIPKLGTYVTSTSTGKTFFIPFDKESGYFNESNSCLTRYYYRNANIEGKSVKLCIGIGQLVKPHQKRAKPKQINSNIDDASVKDQLREIAKYCIPEGGDHTKDTPIVSYVNKKDSLCENSPLSNCCLGSAEESNFMSLTKQDDASAIDIIPHFKQSIKNTVDAFEKSLPSLSNYIANKTEDEKRKAKYLKLLSDCRSQIDNNSIKTFLSANIDFIKSLNYRTNSGRERKDLADKLQIDNLPTSVETNDSNIKKDAQK